MSRRLASSSVVHDPDAVLRQVQAAAARGLGTGADAHVLAAIADILTAAGYPVRPAPASMNVDKLSALWTEDDPSPLFSRAS